MWMGSWLSCANEFEMVVFRTVIGDIEESTKVSKDKRTAPKGS